MIEDKVIVIGGNHHNTLGIIRGLGRNNIKSYAIITDKEYVYVKKSKYVEKYWLTEESKDEIIDILLNNFLDKQKKYFIIPTSDFVVKVLDDNYEKLKDWFIVPNINQRQGMIIDLMNKYRQYQLAQKYQIKMAKTKVIDLKKKVEEDIPIPCILKPVRSIDGIKMDIEICRTKQEFLRAVQKFKDLKYKEILMQEFIENVKEYDFCGCVCGNKVIIPALIDKIRLYPNKRGNTAFGKVLTYGSVDLKKIENMLSELNYNGIINLEIFVKDNQVYLNEINFRNSAISYMFSKVDIYIPYIWLQMNLHKQINMNMDFKEFYFIGEDNELKLLLHHDISLKTFFKDLSLARKFVLWDRKDMKPYLYKFIYMIAKRFKRKED